METKGAMSFPWAGLSLRARRTSDKNRPSFRPLVEKAAADDPSKRYQDAAEFLSTIKRRLSSIADADRETKLAEKSARGILDGEVAEWILEMTDEQLCSRVVSNPAFAKTVVNFTEIDNGNATFVMDAIDQGMTQACKRWKDHDAFADIAKFYYFKQGTI